MADSMQPAPPGLPLEEQPDAEEQEEQEDYPKERRAITTKSVVVLSLHSNQQVGINTFLLQ